MTMFVLALVGKGEPARTKAKLDQVAGVIMMVFVAAVLVYGSYQLRGLEGAKSEARAAAQVIEAQLADTQVQAPSVPASKQSVQIQDAPPPPVPRSSPDAHLSKTAMLEQSMVLLRERLTSQVAATRKYTADIEKLSIDSLLLPETLVSRERLAEATQTLNRYEEITTSFQKAEAARDAVFTQAFFALAKRTDNPDGEIAAFNRAREPANALAKDWGHNQRELLSHFRDVLGLMRGQVGKTAVQDGRLLFQDERALSRYNSIVEEIQPLVEEESALLGKFAAQQRKSAERLKNFGN